MTRRPAHPLQEQIADSLGVRRVQEQIADSLGLRRVLNHVQDQIRAAALVGPAAVHEQIIGSLGPTRMTDVLAAADALSTALQDVGELDRELGCPAADFLRSVEDAADRLPSEVEQYLAETARADGELSGVVTPNRDVSEGVALLVLSLIHI